MLKKFLLPFLVVVSLKVAAQSAVSSVADSLYLLGNYAAAINEYSKIGDATSGIQIARAYTAIGNYEKAIRQYQSVLKKGTNSEIAGFELGKLLLKTKAYDSAYTAFNELIRKDSINPEYHYYLGRVQQQNGDEIAANFSFTNALKSDSTHLRSLYALGKFYVGIQQKDSALPYIDAGLRFYDDDVALIHLKALAFFNDGQYEKAIPYFERLLELGENKPFIRQKLGFSYFRNWQYDEAKEQYYQLLKVENYKVEGYNSLAEVFLREKQLDSAEYYINKYIRERSVDFSMEYADLGRIARLRGQTKKAMEYYHKAWEENTENPLFYFQFCTLADEYYKDPNLKLTNYQKFVEQYNNSMPFLKERADKRIAELKAEIHFSKD